MPPINPGRKRGRSPYGQGGPEMLVRELEAKGIKVDNTRQHGDGPGYSVYINDPSGIGTELSCDPA